MTPDLMVPMRSRRVKRAAVLQKLQHMVPAIALAYGATDILAGTPTGVEIAIAVAEIATTAVLVLAVIRAARGLRRPSHHHEHGIEWIDVWAAGVLFAEFAEHYHRRPKLVSPVLLSAIVTLGIGLMHPRLAARHERRRSLRLTPDRLIVGGHRFRTFTARWDEIAAITIDAREAEIRTHRGRRRRINLADMENAPEISEALMAAQRRLAGVTP